MALEEKLRLIVDATTGTAEANFGKLTTSAERTATAVDTAAESVAAAADRVAQARAREADAAGKLAVEEDKLARARAKYGDDSAQVVAAEERVASAQRRVQLAASGTTQALEAQEVAQRAATETAERGTVATENAGRGTARLREEMSGLKGQVVGLVAGVSLADWLSDSIGGFLNGARGANTLAASMNATVEQGGQLSTLFSTLGLDAADLLEIQAEFATKIGDGGSALEEFGASVKTNKDGTTNWALTLEDALAHLQEIPDATERNATGFRLFGEEGYKQLSRLLTSGVSVEEALERIGTPFSAEDVALTQRYDAAMMRMQLASGDLGRTVAREVVPVMADLAEFANNVVGAITAIPLPIALATAAAVTMAATGFSPLEKGAELVKDGFGKVKDAVANAASSVGDGAGVMSRGFSLAKTGLSGLVDLAGGPLGVAMIAASVAYSLAAMGEQELEDHAREAAAEVEKLGGTSNDQAANSRRLAAQMHEEAGAWENLAAAQRGLAAQRDELKGFEAVIANLGSAFGPAGQSATAALSDEENAARGFEEAINEAREELGEFGAQQEIASQTSQSLNNLIAEGTTSGQAFADAVRDAAEAQNTEALTADTAEAAIAAYNATTRDAVAATRERIDAMYASEDANFAFLEAMDAANTATDDGTTSVDEQREAQVRLMTAALSAADAAADAAVESREAAGDILTDVDRANVRAGAMIDDLRAKLNTPGLSEGAQAEMQALIDQLTIAQENGDIDAVLRLTGADEAAGELDETTADRDATVHVESRGGPAVDEYLDRLANAQRLAIIHVESRGGPDVDRYLDGLSVQRDRLAIIRVESRGGPAVDDYLNSIANTYRLALIHVETRGGPAVQRYLDSLADTRNATINIARGAGAPLGAYGAPQTTGAGRVMLGQVTLDLELTGTAERSQLSAAERGRAQVRDIRAYERENGIGWRR